MTALRDEWQAQRQHRQEEVSARRQEVYSALISIRTQRQDQATQLRSALDLFREELALNDEIRREEGSAFKAELQEFRLQLQQETQRFLDSARDQRQQRAQALLEQLDRYVAALQQQTQRFLSVTQIERLLMAQQLAQDLQAFHTELSQAIAALRRSNQAALQEIMALVKTLQAETQDTLAVHQQQRLARKIKLTQDLAAFMVSLRTDVQDYLTELDLLRQSRAQAVQSSLQYSHAQRIAAVNQLFRNLAVFRGDLNQYHLGLQAAVWGQAQPQPAAPAPQAAPRQTTAKVAPAPSRPRFIPTAPKPTAPKAVAAKPVAIPVAKAPTPSAPPVAVLEPPSPALATLAQVSQELPVPPAVKPLPVIPFVNEPGQDTAAIEKAVYDYVSSTQGARLVEVETALSINRFQAVDALRSLIKKGLLIQRDRLYFIHEAP